jgi:ferredoxin-like protein FixX
MKLYCPACGAESVFEEKGPMIFNVSCMECGGCSVVMMGDQIVGGPHKEGDANILPARRVVPQ